MTQAQIWEIARRQSAFDLCCEPEDFLRAENVVVLSRENEHARRYLSLPFSCQLVTYGGNIVASVQPEYREAAERYIGSFPPEHCFETPNLHVLNDALAPLGQKICFMAEYFLPELELLRALPCGYELRLLHPADFKELYLPQWSNALCEKRKELDVLGVGAYDGGEMLGLAGCSADCEDMWQIGIDVLPEYRGKGIASVLVGNLAIEILEKDRIPFYCAAWSNIASVRTAVKSGFRPAWTELTAKSSSFVTKMTF